MKKIVLFVVSAFILFSCEGPQGPQGPPGYDGGLIVSSAFEIVIDFNASNNYEFVEPYGFDVYPSDVTLVYILWDTANGQDIWRPLPQFIEFNDNSSLIYNFDFTQNDVRFFLEGSTDFSTLDPLWTQNQVFRVVVVPADNVDNVDVNSLDAVTEAYQIDHFNLK